MRGFESHPVLQYYEMKMTIAELKEYLNQFNDDDVVIMSKDAEGNSFSPLSDGESGRYIAETTWSGEFHDSTAALNGWINEDDGIGSVCLYPIN